MNDPTHEELQRLIDQFDAARHALQNNILDGLKSACTDMLACIDRWQAGEDDE